MCVPKPKTPQITKQKPTPAPPPPEPVQDAPVLNEDASQKIDRKKITDSKRAGKRSLRIDLTTAAPGGGNVGLNIPT